MFPILFFLMERFLIVALEANKQRLFDQTPASFIVFVFYSYADAQNLLSVLCSFPQFSSTLVTAY